MIPPKGLRTAGLTLGFFLALVWAGVFSFARELHPVLLGLAFSVVGLAVFAVYLMMARAFAQPAQAGDKEKPTTASGAGRRSDPEIDSVRELIQTANQRLAKSQKVASQRVRTTVEQLPLFIMMGLEGCGKTSTFIRSGLEPELLAGQVFREHQIVPTPACNIWLADGAVFLEVGGSFLSGAPERFGRMLKLFRSGGLSLISHIWRSRRAQNLRGVILYCDAATLLGVPSPAQQSAYSRLLQERLRLAGEVFGCDFPVYVVFTKTEQVKYFGEYFARLTKAELQQVLGCTLSGPRQETVGYSEESESKRLAAALNRLYYSLADKRLMLLPREADPMPRLHAYEFPREVKRFRGTVVQFLVETFRPNPLQPGPLLRGFYFTGIRYVNPEEQSDQRQQRPPIDDATHVLDRDQAKQLLGQKIKGPANVVPQWIFTWDLFSRAILGDRAAARTYGNVRLDWYRRITFGAGIVLLAVFGFLTARSAMRTNWLLNEISETQKQLPDVRSTEALVHLQALDGLRSELENLRKYQVEGLPWQAVWLYPGDDLIDPVRRFYFRRFQQYLLPDVEAVLKTKLARASLGKADSGDSVADQLRAYLSITTQGCEPDPPYLTELWRGGRPADGLTPLARGQFDFFAKERRKGVVPIRLEEDQGLVASGRKSLEASDRMETIYQDLLARVGQAATPASLADYSRDYAQVLKTEGEVRAEFTRSGAAQMLRMIEADNWAAACIFGEHASTGSDAQLKQGLRDRYTRQYVDAWRKFLAEMGVVPYRSADDAAGKLKRLADKESAILSVLGMTYEHTSFTDPSLASISQAFQPVRMLLPPTPKVGQFAGDQNEGYRNALFDLQQAMERLHTHPTGREEIDDVEKTRQTGLSTVRKLSNHFPTGGVDREVETLLRRPIQAAEGIGDPTRAIQTDLGAVCGIYKSFLGRKPFKTGASGEVGLDELGKFFAFDGGALWKFYGIHLEPSIEERNGQWVQKSSGAEVKVGPSFLQWFSHVANISKALFRPGGKTPDMAYEIEIKKPGNVDTLSFNVGTGELSEGLHALQWPVGNPPQFYLETRPGAPLADWKGPWSLFEMAQKAKRQTGVLVLDCSIPQGSSECKPAYGRDGTVRVNIRVSKPPNGVEGSLDKDFFDLGRCPTGVDQ